MEFGIWHLAPCEEIATGEEGGKASEILYLQEGQKEHGKGPAHSTAWSIQGASGAAGLAAGAIRMAVVKGVGATV